MMDSNNLMKKGFDSILNPTEQFASEASFGKKILVMAWCVEILAAMTGLIIAWVMAYGAYEQLPITDFNGKINAFLGALPFIVIAIIELAKIPLAGGLYKVKIIGWRILILIALLLLTTVTFETMYTGLERQQSNINGAITRLNNQITAVDKELINLESQKKEIGDISKGEILNEIEQKKQALTKTAFARIDKIQQRKELETDALEKQKNVLLDQMQVINNQGNNPILELFGTQKNEIERVGRSDVNGLNIEIDKLNKRTALIEEKLDSKRNIFEKKIADYESKADKNKDEMRVSVEREIINEEKKLFSSQARINALKEDLNKKIQNIETQHERTVSSLRSDHQLEIKKLEKEISQIKEQRIKLEKRKERKQEKLEKQISNMERDINEKNKANSKDAEANRSNLRSKVEEFNREIKNIRDESDKEIKKIQADLYAGLAPLIQATKNVNNIIADAIKNSKEISIKIKNTQEKINNLDEEKRIRAEQSQTYRLAKLFFSKDDINEVTQEELSLVSFIWFGSIAFIISTIGTVLALISYILRDPEAFSVRKKRSVGRRISRVSYLISARLLRLITALIGVINAISKNILAFTTVFRGLIGKPLQKSLRSMSISIRKRMNKPKIVIEEKEILVEKIVEKVVVKEVEVPVEKIVEKEIPVDRVVVKEVPKEIVRKEIVYVPLYSTDSGLIDTNKETLSNAPFAQREDEDGK